MRVGIVPASAIAAEGTLCATHYLGYPDATRRIATREKRLESARESLRLEILRQEEERNRLDRLGVTRTS